VDRSPVCNGRLRRDPVLGQPTPGSAGGVLRKPGTIPVIFPLFPLFPLFFDGTEMQYCWKNWLVVKVRSLRAGLWLQYSTYVLYWQIRKVLRNGMLTHTPIHPEYQGRGEASHHELSASPQCIIDRRFAPTIKINHWPVLESWTFLCPQHPPSPLFPRLFLVEDPQNGVVVDTGLRISIWQIKGNQRGYSPILSLVRGTKQSKLFAIKGYMRFTSTSRMVTKIILPNTFLVCEEFSLPTK